MKRAITCAFVLLAALALRGEPFVPKDVDQPLEGLRTRAFDPGQRELRQTRADLARDAGNPTLAAKFARCCLDRYRSEADPRYLGRAQAAMALWWNAPTPPVGILVLRATIKQSQHEFTAALADLDTAIRLDPRNPQAWLTRATVLTVLGRYADARKACAPLAQLAPGLIAVTAAANVACLNGGAQTGCGLLRRAIDSSPSAGTGEKLWALTLLGETCERLGRTAEAEAAFKEATALGERDPYLLGVRADILLDESRAQEVADLLKDEIRADGLLLRLTMAEARLVPLPAPYEGHLAALQARFEAGHLRGDFVHQREEARFQLSLLHHPDEALRLAQANWEIQHEPADVRILIDSARAARRPEAAEPALNFVKTNHLEGFDLK